MVAMPNFSPKQNTAGLVRPPILGNIPKIELPKPVPALTDDEIREKIRSRFKTLRSLTKAIINSSIRAMVLSGPPGLGKSYETMDMLQKWDPAEENHTFISGFTRATGLYKQLYEHREKGQVLVFDDCDSVFYDGDGLNILKCALDTTDKRWISWGAETKMTDSEGEPLPTRFLYDGSVIFISNIDFDDYVEGNRKLSEHMKAIIDRSYYLSLGIKDRREYLIRIQQVIEEGQMLRKMGISATVETEVVKFIEDNIDRLREPSVRTARKLGLLVLSGDDWRTTAEHTLMRNK